MLIDGIDTIIHRKREVHPMNSGRFAFFGAAALKGF